MAIPKDRHIAVTLAISAGLFLLLCFETIFRVAVSLPITGAYIVAAVTNIPIQIGIIVFCARYWDSKLFFQYGFNILRTSLLGIGFIGLAVGVFAPLLYSHPLDQLAVIRWALTTGFGAGFYTGYNNSRVLSERVSAERAEVQAQEAARRQELLEYLNAVLRHEVLNAAQIIQGRSLFLKEERLEESEVRTHLGTIERQADDLSDIVDDVRTLLKANKQGIDLSRMDATEAVQDSLNKIKGRHDYVETNVQLPTKAIIEANDLFHRVFDNIFRNSIEHNETSPARIVIMGRKTDAEFVVEIQDNGSGIPENLREGLFEPTVDNSSAETRLGTVIIGRLIEQHNGTVELIDTGPSGTTIEVRLPLA